MEKSFDKRYVIIATALLAVLALVVPWLISTKEVAIPCTIIVFHFLVILSTSYFIRRYKWSVYCLFIILPLISLPILLAKGQDWFIIAKTYTIIVYLLWIQFSRDIKKLNSSRVMFIGIYALLVINIAEAMLRDYQNGYYINTISGLILCLTIPSIKKMKVNTSKKWNDFNWDMGIVWMFFYAVWNVTFVYSTFPHGGLTQIAVNLVPLLVGLVNSKLWLQTRVITLATHMMIRIYFTAYNDSMFFNITNQTSGFLPSINILHGVTLGLGIAAIIEVLLKREVNNVKYKRKTAATLN